MTEETNFFIEKLVKLRYVMEELSLVVDTFSNEDDSDDLIIQQLSERINGLKSNVMREGSLNAGGKFEWVDSILVKCLQEGCWLLVDNVNLCSPAVLDRLNALLEPKGVLTIGERGVNELGEMVNIKPHPNFRLFLTMDPKNGEISRAMRNRGLEIYMLTENENCEENTYDLKSLINQQGLEGNKNITSLINVHQYICSIILGEKPTLNHMLKASFLISQQILRGIGITEAFCCGVVDVYIKSRSSNDFSVSEPENVVTSYINEILRENFVEKADSMFGLDYTLKTRELQRNCSLEKIKQQLALVNDLAKPHLELEPLVAETFTNSFSAGSFQDLAFKQQCCRDLFPLFAEAPFDKLNDVLGSTLLEMFKNDFFSEDVPIDGNWLRDSLRKCTTDSAANKIFLTVYYKAKQCLKEKEDDLKFVKKQQQFTILQCSSAVADGKISGTIVNDELLKNFVLLLNNFDEYFEKAVASSSADFSDELTFAIISLVQWRFILYQLGKTNLLEKLKIHKTNTRSLFVHYKWFFKYAITAIQKLCNEPMSEDFSALLEKINSATNVAEGRNAFDCIAKQFRKVVVKPLPETDEVRLETLQQFNKYLLNINPWFSKATVYLLNLFILEEPFKRQLIETIEKLYLNNVNEIAEIVKMLEEFLQKYDLNTRSFKQSDVDMLLFREYFANLGVVRYNSEILGDVKSCAIDKSLLRKSLGAHGDFCALLDMYESSQDERLLIKLQSQLTEYLLHAPNLFDEVLKIATDDQETNNYLSLYSARLLPMITKLLVCKEGSSQSVITGTLGNFRDKRITHRFLNLALWRNLEAIPDSKFDIVKCNSKFLFAAYNRFIVNLLKCLRIYDENNFDVAIGTILCMKEIERLYSDKEEVHRLTALLHSLFEQILHMNTRPEDEWAKDKIPAACVAKCFVSLSYLEFMLNSRLPLIDPLAKVALKLQYAKEERAGLEDMKTSFELQNKVFSNSCESLHPYCKLLDASVKSIKVKEAALVEKFAIRPQNLSYGTLKDVVDNIRKLIEASISTVEDAVENISCKHAAKRSGDAQNLKGFAVSLKNATSQLIKYRIGFSDIAESILNAMFNLLYGVQVAIDVNDFVKTGIACPVEKLVEFPCAVENSSADISMTWSNAKVLQEVKGYFQKHANSKISKRLVFKVFRNYLRELFNECALEIKWYSLDKDSFALFDNYLREFSIEWMQQEEDKEVRKKESENLYKMVTKCDDLSEEEQLKVEMREMFPNYHELDFADLYNTDLDDDRMEVVPEDNVDKPVDAIKYEDVQLFCELHAQLLNASCKTEWLTPAKLNTSINYDLVTPLLQRFEILKVYMEDNVNSINYAVDGTHVGSLNILVAVAQNYGNADGLCDSNSSPTRRGHTTSKRYDFYKDQNVDEVKSCYHIIEELKRRILELLAEWNDHPTLNTILSIINRIYAFPITSPVTRFLTGLEILLSKCHEWEENAHSGVSVADYSTQLTHQIISWRKLELNGWKDCLNNAFDRMNYPIAKWWLHMYNLMTDFIISKKNTDNELLKLVQAFVEKSSLAEFKNRLELLYVFHCHSVGLEKSERRDTFMCILWNLYCYYGQFLQGVETRIKDRRAPIEKKLKDFVKIARWNDINYWAIKDTVEKTHKTLHKYVKEFETVLKEPVTSCLVNNQNEKTASDHVGIWDRPQRISPKKYHYSLEPSNYVSKQSKNIFEPLAEDVPQGMLLNKAEQYLTKMGKLCKDSLNVAAYPNLIQNLDTFVTEIIETSDHLKGLDIDTTLTKEKQKSQAKHIHNQKKMALADLFKTLAKIGLSYRTGIIESKIRADRNPEFLLKPINLETMLSHLKYDRTDEKLLTIWKGSEMYFYRSIAAQAALDAGIVNPSADLGLPNIERIKGFSQHLTVLVQEQKSKLIETSRLLYYLRYYMSRLTEHNYAAQEFVDAETLRNIQKILRHALHLTEQFKILLMSCPEQCQLENENVDVPILNNTDSSESWIEYKFDANWNKAMSDLNGILSACQKTVSDIENTLNRLPAVEYTVFYPKCIPVTSVDFPSAVKSICEKLTHVKGTFSKIPTSSGLNTIIERLTTLTGELTLSDSAVSETSVFDPERLKKHVENLIKNSLLVVQNVYKKYAAKKNVEKDQDPDEEVAEKSVLNDGHLKTQIMDEIFDDVALLDMKLILRNVHAIVKYLDTNVNQQLAKPLIQRCVPLLEQVVLFYQYFVTQQVSAYRTTCKMNSILLNIFGTLAAKGFCIAPEFAEDLKDDTEGKQSGGIGLGDGKGEKDISDQIENEDQLDDTHVEGQEKEKNEDEDCKEEGKGIEMSEDFDSKLQDVEKPEDDEEKSGDDDSDSDAEKQMGDTKEGADKLDEQIWGSDEEIEEEEQGGDDKKEEKGDGGEKEGQQEMTAKEEGSGANEDEEDEENDKEDGKKEKPKEINEIDEPEYDDDQVDPYHGNQPELPEPEPMDLPDDLQLDDGETKEETEEENPFDVDKMKDQKDDQEENKDEVPEGPEEDENKQSEEQNGSDSDSENEQGDDDSQKQTGEEEPNETVPETEEKGDEKEDPVEDNVESGMDQQQSAEDKIQAMETNAPQSADNVQSANEKSTEKSVPTDETMDEDNPDKDGTGQAQMEESSTGHKGKAQAQQDSFNAMKEETKKQEKRRRPGKADSKHTLGDEHESAKKKLKTIDAKENEEGEEADAEEVEDESRKDAELYQHVKEAQSSDTQALDAATKEQADTQQVSKTDEDMNEDLKEIEENLTEENEEPEVDVEEAAKKKSEKSESSKSKKSDGKRSDGDVIEELTDVQVEGDKVDTMTVPRGGESAHFTQFELLENAQVTTLSAEEMNQLRTDLQTQLGQWNEPPPNVEAENTWEKISSLTSSLAQDLSEQLRLVLEPTQASRLRGDFRTGRRINMRKVIPYIASQFRKDKIWLRRTKPSKREYQIVLAIDDSSSMADNHSKELAFESIALISKALSLLESGQLSVVSFGEGTEIVHKLSDTFTEKTGTKLLQRFQFQQKKTCVSKLVDFVTEMFSTIHTTALNAKLLIVVSDGRGIFSEGESIVHQAVRRAKFANIFMIFVIVDNPENKDSILDIRIPVFDQGKLLGIKSYMDSFPFPFYIILREINSLPAVLSDALRQWFELISNVDKQ